MPYPELFVAPMRKELTDLGVRELRTAEDVEAADMLERSDIENRDARAIAAKMTAAFDQFCATTTTV